MKYIVFSSTPSCVNSKSYFFHRRPSVLVVSNEQIKDAFKILKKDMIDDYEDFKTSKLLSHEGYKVGITITIIDSETNSYRIKEGYIDPTNLKIKG